MIFFGTSISNTQIESKTLTRVFKSIIAVVNYGKSQVAILSFDKGDLSYVVLVMIICSDLFILVNCFGIRYADEVEMVSRL